MTTTDRPSTWRDVERDALDWAADWIASGYADPTDPGEVDTWAHQTAEGSGHVIWTVNAWALWLDVDAPAAESEAVPSTDPVELVTAYAAEVVTGALLAAVDLLTVTYPDAAPCTACGAWVTTLDDPARRLVTEVRTGGGYDWCTASDDHAHHKGARTLPVIEPVDA